MCLEDVFEVTETWDEAPLKYGRACDVLAAVRTGKFAWLGHHQRLPACLAFVFGRQETVLAPPQIQLDGGR